MDMEFLESFRAPQPNRPSRVELRGAIALYLCPPQSEAFADIYRRRKREAEQMISREQAAIGYGDIPETVADFAVRHYLETQNSKDTENS